MSFYSACLSFFVCMLTVPMAVSCGQPDDYITYEWLKESKESASVDFTPHFRRLFNSMKVRGLLECGCGMHTKYFLDNCPKVISIDHRTPEIKSSSFQKCVKVYGYHTNWLPLVYNADLKDKSFNLACLYQSSKRKDYSSLDSRYAKNLEQFFRKYLTLAQQDGTPIDVAFVDSEVCLRGDMVKILIANRVPVVVAHDTESDVSSNSKKGVYGWFKVQTPTDYEKIYIPFGHGTTFWVRKDLGFVVSSLTAYRESIEEANKAKNVSWDMLTELADQLAIL